MPRVGRGRPRHSAPVPLVRIMTALRGRALIGGSASGTTLVLDDSLSFWGGVDPASGTLIDPHHPQRGATLTGSVLVLPAGRGSSSSSSVLAEMARLDTAPAALILAEPDLILAIGAAVAEELYGRIIPLIVVDHPTFASIPNGVPADVRDGSIQVG
jgi:uncharacterized protein